MMIRTFRSFAVAALAVVFLGCSVNIFENFGDKTTDAALLESAKSLIDSGNYSGALQEFAAMSSEYRSQRSVVPYYASAYAGRCGLNALDLISDIDDLGSTRIFPFLMDEYPSGTQAEETDCASAEELMETIDLTATNRTDDENLLMAMIGLSKMGVVLSQFADTDANGAVDAGFDPCTTASLPDADVRQFGSSLSRALGSLSALSSTSFGGSSTTDLDSVCSALATYAPSYDFCSVTDPAAFTANQIKGIRSVINENSVVGLGTCTGSIATCVCF